MTKISAATVWWVLSIAAFLESGTNGAWGFSSTSPVTTTAAEGLACSDRFHTLFPTSHRTDILLNRNYVTTKSARNSMDLSLFSSSSSSEKEEEGTDIPTTETSTIGVIDSITIEYCPGCRWMTKAFWMATELLSKFDGSFNGENNGRLAIRGVTVVPAGSGTFRITARTGSKSVQLWDRTVDGGFPPIDLVEFERRVAGSVSTCGRGGDGGERLEESDNGNDNNNDNVTAPSDGTTHVVVRYCPDGSQLLKAVYYGQELLTTFSGGELASVALVPETGDFSVELLGSRGTNADETKSDGRALRWDFRRGAFPQPKELKQWVRDSVKPDKDLGHSDTKGKAKGEEKTTAAADQLSGTADDAGECIPCNEASEDSNNDNDNDNADKTEGSEEGWFEEMDDDDAEEARRYFGVM